MAVHGPVLRTRWGVVARGSLTAANDGDPEESLINVLNRFAKDVGKPMPRAILRVISGKSDEDAVITLIDQLDTSKNLAILGGK